MSSEGAAKFNRTSSRRSQSGGLGKRAGRNMKRTMQPRNGLTRRVLLAETASWVATRLIVRGSLESSCDYNEKAQRTAGVGSATCTESTVVKVGKVPRVAEALPHSEGAAYKQQAKSQRVCGTGAWGRSRP